MEKTYEIIKKIVFILALVYFIGFVFDTELLPAFWRGEPKKVEELFIEIFHLRSILP